MSNQFAVIDMYDGGTGETVVSSHKTLVAAMRKRDKLQNGVNKAYPNALAKYGVIHLLRPISANEYYGALEKIDNV